jgi:hypothetical protein
MKTLLIAALMLGGSVVAHAHEPWISEATGPTQSLEDSKRGGNNTQYTAMNWMCPGTDEEQRQVEKEWPGHSQMACFGFARAVADTLVITGQACIPQQLTTREIVAVGEEYLDDHPDRDYALDDSAARLLIEAVTKKWPCVQS